MPNTPNAVPKPSPLLDALKGDAKVAYRTGIIGAILWLVMRDANGRRAAQRLFDMTGSGIDLVKLEATEVAEIVKDWTQVRYYHLREALIAALFGMFAALVMILPLSSFIPDLFWKSVVNGVLLLFYFTASKWLIGKMLPVILFLGGIFGTKELAEKTEPDLKSLAKLPANFLAAAEHAGQASLSFLLSFYRWWTRLEFWVSAVVIYLNFIPFYHSPGLAFAAAPLAIFFYAGNNGWQVKERWWLWRALVIAAAWILLDIALLVTIPEALAYLAVEPSMRLGVIDQATLIARLIMVVVLLAQLAISIRIAMNSDRPKMVPELIQTSGTMRPRPASERVYQFPTPTHPLVTVFSWMGAFFVVIITIVSVAYLLNGMHITGH